MLCDIQLIPHTDGSVNVPEFLNAAADFCNGSVFGTLSCSMSIHPVTERRHSYAFEAFLGDLKYGSIIVNGSTNLGVTFTTMPWGAWAAAGTLPPMNMFVFVVNTRFFFQQINGLDCACS